MKWEGDLAKERALERWDRVKDRCHYVRETPGRWKSKVKQKSPKATERLLKAKAWPKSQKDEGEEAAPEKGKSGNEKAGDEETKPTGKAER